MSLIFINILSDTSQFFFLSAKYIPSLHPCQLKKAHTQNDEWLRKNLINSTNLYAENDSIVQLYFYVLALLLLTLLLLLFLLI